jgi:hypothetical protein
VQPRIASAPRVPAPACPRPSKARFGGTGIAVKRAERSLTIRIITQHKGKAMNKLYHPFDLEINDEENLDLFAEELPEQVQLWSDCASTASCYTSCAGTVACIISTEDY